MKTSADFNREYLRLHVAKEDLFWTTYMGVDPDAKKLEAADLAMKGYVSDASHLREVRAALAVLPPGAPEDERVSLEGWRAFFEAHCVEGAEPLRLQGELVKLESDLFAARAKVRLTYRTATGEEKVGSTNVMASNIAASDDEVVRRTSHEALLGLERWVLAHDFLELVKRRNAFARALGFPDFFSAMVQRRERMSAEHLGELLDEFEQLTRDANLRELARVAKEKGPGALAGHNLKYAVAGDVERRLDPYLPFAKSLERWAHSFSRLGITYRGAALTLDLLERAGKYENGFMHGPQPCFYDQGRWVPARINFTSNASPGQVGSGRRGLHTLFHEGGHAAHFANVTQPAPCFSQEYPPTSMAHAETQSMLLDSLIGDPDWLALYAKDAGGGAVPMDLLRRYLSSEQPFRAFQERSLLVVPVFERRLYALADADLTPARVLELARACEKEVLGVECSPRPLLAIPHLLSAEGACSYQGYLLAHMGVYQTRDRLEERLGFLADNPQVGPLVSRHYWAPGNRLAHAEMVAGLTGEPFSGRALADSCNQAVDALWKKAERRIAEALARPRTKELASLDASIRLVHGAEVFADNRASDGAMFEVFERFVARETH